MPAAAPSVSHNKEVYAITQAIKNTGYLFNQELKDAERFLAKRDTESALLIATRLARFAYLNFTGYYASYRLENLLQKIGAASIQTNTNVLTAHKGRRILHIASELYELGGHTPLLLKWIQRDISSEHHIFLTRQKKDQLPQKIFASHQVSPSVVTWANNGQGIVDTARALLAKAVEYDFIVLHIHPDDVVPILAFSGSKPVPVYFLNHADHCFWLGTSIIDGLIQLREPPVEQDKIHRGLTNIPQFVLPIPVNEGKPVIATQENVRAKYGIDKKYSKLMLTTSTESKFNPLLEYNYFESVIPVLNQNPDTLLLIVGIKETKPLAQLYQHPQIKYLGYRLPDELQEIENMADIYLETFPFSSFTALLQVLMKKKPVHFMYAPPDIFRLFMGESVYTKNRNKWQERLSYLLQHKQELEAYTEELYHKVSAMYTEKAWLLYLQKFYAHADANKLPQPLRSGTDRMFNGSLNEFFLYGVSLKEKYQFVLFEDKSKLTSMIRRVQYMRLHKTCKALMDLELKVVVKGGIKLLINTLRGK